MAAELGAERAVRLKRRGTVVMAIVLMALLAFGTTTQTWLTVSLPQDAVQTPDLDVAGSDAATPVTAFALVSLAGAFAVSIAGRIARWVVAIILLVAGVGIAFVSLQVTGDPTAAAAPSIGEAIGISGGAGATVTTTAMPWVAAGAGLLLAAAAVWLIIAGRSWGQTRRYEKNPQGAAPAPGTAHAGEIDSWDRLTHGEDPTR
ncbi:putative membrane protein (TIGR02234 family) [Arthrobacter sp. CAN_A214]|uniref:Trp biosynthesis-associated membrane protein n=1 Tax=Arthrobacter sp. CAN_A214 TaxID=2787720 RepID=UPI0018C984E7